MTLFIEDAPVGFATSCSMEITAETRETSYKGSGGWITKAQGNKSWSASADGLLRPDYRGAAPLAVGFSGLTA